MHDDLYPKFRYGHAAMGTQTGNRKSSACAMLALPWWRHSGGEAARLLSARSGACPGSGCGRQGDETFPLTAALL